MLLLRYLLEKGLLSVEILGAQHTAAAGISELRHLMVPSLPPDHICHEVATIYLLLHEK